MQGELIQEIKTQHCCVNWTHGAVKRTRTKQPLMATLSPLICLYRPPLTLYIILGRHPYSPHSKPSPSGAYTPAHRRKLLAGVAWHRGCSWKFPASSRWSRHSNSSILHISILRILWTLFSFENSQPEHEFFVVRFRPELRPTPVTSSSHLKANQEPTSCSGESPRLPLPRCRRSPHHLTSEPPLPAISISGEASLLSLLKKKTKQY
mgnify:CR=1 FL=1